jgi:hypothetical protein
MTNMKTLPLLDHAMLWVARAFLIYLLAKRLFPLSETNQAWITLLIYVVCTVCVWDNHRLVNRIFLLLASLVLLITLSATIYS